MYLEELLIIIVIAVAVVLYRNYQGQNVGKYITSQVQIVYDKFAPKTICNSNCFNSRI